MFTYNLHSLHVHPTGFHFLIFLLNSVKVEDFLNSFGTRAQIFGPLNNKVSVPLKTECTFLDWKGFLFLKLWGLVVPVKIWFIIGGDRLLINLYISIASFWRLRWWIVKELSLFKRSLNVSRGSLYTNLSALSCKPVDSVISSPNMEHPYEGAIPKLWFDKGF